MSKKILITGAAGFIGFHLAKYLAQKGNTVLGVDNFNSYYDPLLKEKRRELLEKEGISILRADIAENEVLRKITEEFEPDNLVHLAAQAGVRYSTECPQAYIKANIEGFLNVLETCRAFPHIPLTYASSSSVYGLNEKVPFDTTDRTDHQASLYGVTKKCNELMAYTYHHLYKVKSTGLRFFTVYGPWGRPDMAYFSFTKAILAGQPISIFNDGNMERDFTYIDDIIAGIDAAIEKNCTCEVYNLGNHKPEKLMSLVESLEKHLNRKAILIKKPMQLGDVVATYADIEKSQKDLGFSPKISLDEGLGRFVAWYRNFYPHPIT
ncbi:MAG: SDR family NAD(P)-dependent oxidoreductase [Parachlamydiales bacterium]|jgi:UDP-glucuronate 4-epimerase